MKTKLMAALAAILSTGLVSAQSEASPSNEAAQPVRAKLSDAAKAEFKSIAELERGLKGKRGPERLIALQGIAQRCEETASAFSHEPAAAMRAWYDAGEAWRRHGSLEPAAVAFGRALDQADDRYRARALYGLAQMQRRLKQLEAAIATYTKCARYEPGSVRAHDARVWIARCHMAEDKFAESLAAFRAACEAAPGPLQRIGAGNWLAKALIASGDLEAAERELTAVEQAVKPVSDSDDPAAARVRKALEQMSARRALQRARDKANGAASDAIDVERAGAQRTPMP